MYARLTMFTLGPGTRPTAEKIADQLAPALRDRKGFKNVTFFMDEGVGEYGSLTLYESKEDAEAGNPVEPKLQEILADIVKGPPTLQLFEVYEPKT
jgi:heme-degrading monooxygenase HmoA